MRFVAEEGFGGGVGVGGVEAVNCGWIACRDVQLSCRVEGEIPNVVGFGIGWAELGCIEDDRCGGVVLLGIGIRLEPIDLPTRQRGGIERSSGPMRTT